MEALILLFMLMAARSSGGGSSSPSPSLPAPTEPRAQQTSTTPPPEAQTPWPQVVPQGLPEFPSGWEYDEPPPKEVRDRAWALLQTLWKTGQGSKLVEQTAGRWITYRAEITKGQKKGVVAYRLKRPAAVPSPQAPAPQLPNRNTASIPAPAPPAAAQSPGVPVSVPQQQQQTPAATAAPPRVETRPLLVQGAGKGALKHLAPYVTVVQEKLRVDLSRGGRGEFGPRTYQAVMAFQVQRGLKPDGKVGDLTWAALDTITAAAA